jgi:prepilin-type N-terminal cleavage/methylation domain-containing protein
MKRFLEKHNKGFSFVEVLCAVAIMSIVSITVGTVIVVSAKTYRNGVSETTVQQEAQLAANTIGNIIKDASEVISDGTNVLKVVTNQNKQYIFTYYSSSKIIKYKEISSDATETTEQLLASNISSFSVDTGNFADTRSITVDMEVTDESTGRSIPLSYTMNSRNEIASDVTYADVGEEPVIIFLEDMACIVPGEGEDGTDRYRIPVYISGNLDVSKLEKSCSPDDGKLQVGAITRDYVEIYVKKEDYSSCKSSYELTLRTKETEADASPVTSSTCMVYIRSATKLTTTYSVDISSTSNKYRESKGAVYTFTAAVQGYNLAKFNREFDLKYENAYDVDWSYELKANSITYTYDSSKAEGAQYSDQINAEKYVKVSTSSSSDTTRPTFTLTLTDDMPSDFSLKVTATSKHAKGVNKAGSSYATVRGEATVLKISDMFEVTLEPNETQEFDLGDMIKSTISDSSNITFKYFTANDDNEYYKSYNPASGTSTQYLKSTKKVSIKIGNDEKGNGYNEGDEPYTFYIGIYVDDKLASRIKVHVRRIDYLHVKIEDSGDDVYADTGTVYHFKVRYNSTTDGQPDKIIQYLINTTNDEDLANALAVELSWAIKNEKDENKIESSDLKSSGNTSANGYSVILPAVVDRVVVKEKWSMAEGIKDNKKYIKTSLKDVQEEKFTCTIAGSKYYAIVKYPMVRIYYEDDEMTKVLGYSMVQPAELDIRLEDPNNSAIPVTSCEHSGAAKPDLTTLGTSIGLSANKKLVVKAVAKHPYKGYNRGGKDYVLNEDDITDVYVLSQKSVTTGNSEYVTVNNFARGNDNFIYSGSSLPSVSDKYDTAKYKDAIRKTVFRYREVKDDGSTGPWSGYYDTLENSLAIKLNGINNETSIFLPNKSYDVEFAEFVYTYSGDSSKDLDVSEMTLIWPCNDTFRSLIGVKAGNTSWTEISKETSWDDFAQTFRIGKTTVTQIDDFGGPSNCTTVGSSVGDTYIHFSLSNFDSGHFQNKFKIKVQEKIDGKWVTISNDGNSDYVSKYKDVIEVKMDSGQLALYVSQNASQYMDSGRQYSVTIELISNKDNPCFYKISGTTFKWKTVVESLSFEIGTAYIKIP